MTIQISVPAFPESISEGELSKWYKNVGDYVERDALLVDVETEKTTLEIPCPVSGILVKILKEEGTTVEGKEIIAEIEEGIRPTVSESTQEFQEATPSEEDSEEREIVASPSARRLALESGIGLSSVIGTGRGGMITRDDVAVAVRNRSETADRPVQTVEQDDREESPTESGERVERRVPMTRLRATIANRLVEAQHNAAMLTTFNEVDMDPIMRMRRQYQEEFQASHNGTRLGFMSFFVRASVEALKRFPLVNASIDGSEIVYHGFYDIGVAVSTDRGLVVPIVRDADALGMAQIEDQISAYGEKARSGKLAIEDMQGGTFTISNGGVFGSLLSTPILNPPQTAILGMHKIEERPVVVDGEIVARPMMYLALSYDHRLIDGREAVRFLVAIKGMLEDPARILLEL
ncbi:MAG: 2-oxoglutarate dehydrogenase complex dihydrolipoyllysine-residue succinyltransferase [Gammaproteobacteria bacterium]|nr:2-oxoglutarate dehydrogenase complex dihydrolipoyllysine-residue succinyltransferase [Gammaproteobacteria bacterium]MYD80036.1 2-oxoglutarate dehydrogenase complex dihydrolipoyllysine-residue succinyltransferase [Gammaproteobacteria bacterium]